MNVITTTRIFMFLSAAFEAKFGIVPHRDWIALIRLMEAADEAREKLATSDSVLVDVPYIYGPARLTVRIMRADLMAAGK